MQIITPEKLVGMKEPTEMFHHGTCDRCLKEYTLVYHINYDKPVCLQVSFRLCLKCIKKLIKDYNAFTQ